MKTEISADIISAAAQEARECDRDIADVSLDAIARRIGISRSTLYRRIGSRQALDDAVRAAGIDPGGRPDVRERAVGAAAELVRRGGLQALTLNAVAARADCSLPALHSQLGGREGLLAALFDRYSPLPRIERMFGAGPASFRDRVRAIYAAVFDAATAESALLGALLADALARPDGPTARHITGNYLPRLLGSIGRWLAMEVEAGRCRRLPLPLLLQLLAGPMALHVATRGLAERVSGLTLPPRAQVIDLLTDAYCRAVALAPSEEADTRSEATMDTGAADLHPGDE